MNSDAAEPRNFSFVFAEARKIENEKLKISDLGEKIKFRVLEISYQ